MSGRRPADGQPEGQPPAKKPAFDINSIRAQLAAKKAEVEARLAGSGSGSASPAPAAAAAAPPKPPAPAPAPRPAQSSAPGPAALPPKATVDPAIAARIAAAKARIDALQNKKAEKPNPYVTGVASTSAAPPPPKPAASGGVSSVALHPLLMTDTSGSGAGEKNEKKAMRDRYRTMAPKFSTVRANAAIVEEAQKVIEKTKPALATAAISNPYAAGAAPAPVAPGAPGNEADAGGPSARGRKSRKMQFSAPGRYVRQGDQLRNEIKLEELKQRIAAQSVKAGLDSEFDVVQRSLKRAQPPVVEWWDEAILPKGATYDDVDKADEYFRTSEDSLITHLVQHPIAIAAPSDRKQPERGLMLTKKEQKKMRRQRRLAELEDKRDRQKMGLIPPDPPKVRLANLMKVLTSDAVQDPTKVEAKVRREVAMRQFRHEKDNESRKLTKEQRHEKEYEKLAQKERNDGLYASVYIVKYLTNGRHKFKVRETAKNDLLSGICVFHPNFALVVVEGVQNKIRHYRQLMLHRIDWTEEARPHGEADDDESDGSDDEEKKKKAEGEEGPDMSENKCELIWEGEIPERTFKIFRARHAETDGAGKDWLTQKYEGMWDLAKRWTWQGEDL
ncbi:U4/U5/U6 small nuclear ribonucleoprotein prp3 [Vanrija albida]|uniref:U4/U5/U6 small nuclear ribonucleoprotein prp3 n=1 Tax=Vanrija albida TaxID=181172 RepID=A0ABR3Q4I5_9TREE